MLPQIDVNGDKQLEWSEFTEFCVQAGVATRAKTGPASFLYRYDSKYEDRFSHGPHIQAVTYDADVQEVIVLEGASTAIKFYDQGACVLGDHIF